VDSFLQVPDLEVLILVNGKELTVPGSELGAFLVMTCLILEVQETPLYLGDWELARVVPYRQREGVVLVVDRYGATGEAH